QKNGFPRFARQLLERGESAVLSQERIQQFLRALGRQRIQPQLAVTCLAAPSVLIVWTVVHQQQQTRGPQTVDQTVEQRLCFAVDPMQILEDQEQRLLAR